MVLAYFTLKWFKFDWRADEVAGGVGRNW